MSEYTTPIVNIDFEIQDSSWPDLKTLSIDIAMHLFQKLQLGKLISQIEFSIIFTDNEYIKEVNSKYRNKSSSTNTLSFPAHDISPNNLQNAQIHDGFLYLGDIIFAYMVIKDEAARDKKTFNDHFTHLLIHSILHLLGYDHIDPIDAEEMESLEVEILSSLNIKSPYEIT